MLGTMFSLLPSRSASQIKCGFSHTLLNKDEDVEVDERTWNIL